MLLPFANSMRVDDDKTEEKQQGKPDPQEHERRRVLLTLAFGNYLALIELAGSHALGTGL